MNEIDKILSRPTNKLAPDKGRLLVSEPFLRDMFFKRSVILLADYNTDGSFGLIINKPIEFRFNQVVEGFPEFEAPIYMGGPVNSESIYFIHTVGDLIQNSYEIMHGLYWGGDIEDVKILIENKTIDKNQIKFFLGYAGWSPNQLEEELERKSWVITHTRPSEIMFKQSQTFWKEIVESMGKDFEIWTRFPVDPALN